MPKTRPILITGSRLVTMADGAPDEQAGSLLVIDGKIAEIIAQEQSRQMPRSSMPRA